MKNWSDAATEEECSWRAERRDAMRVAAQLGIPFHTFDFEEQYRKHVYEYMIAEYKAGRTPNPDVLCNKYMKFDLFMQEADKLGCAFIATGHYARRKEDADGMVRLLAGTDSSKDQSYFLCQLTQPQLKRALFPVGDLEKAEVRKIAHAHHLAVAGKKDSQGICFIGAVNMAEFLKERISEHEGEIVTTKGDVVGFHQGFEFYTVGQRTGLGVGGGTPYYVVDRKPETNQVVVAIGADDPALFKTTVRATNLTETIPGNFQKCVGKKVLGRVRYRQPLASCAFVLAGNEMTVTFDEPQRAVAPGQFVALYEGEELLGSGVIC
jgi:tRNA-specific 2-thiouridylase